MKEKWRERTGSRSVGKSGRVDRERKEGSGDKQYDWHVIGIG